MAVQQIQTASICVGGSACPNGCPFCVAEQTPTMGVRPKPGWIDWRRFRSFMYMIMQERIRTVLLTSKGEPLLWPDLITEYLDRLRECRVPLIELQTSGVLLKPDDQRLLDGWADRGLTTVSLSVVHHEDAINAECYRKPYPPLVDQIRLIRKTRLSVRLNCMLVKGWIDSPAKVDEMLAFARANDVMQVTVRPITVSDGQAPDARALQVMEWTRLNQPTADQLQAIVDHYSAPDGPARLIDRLPHGADVYHVDGPNLGAGQNLCISNCLTHDPGGEFLRQIIWINNDIATDWRFAGARLL